MRAESFDPTQLSLTSKAREHVREQLKSEEACGLVLGVSETGCNGYMYELDFLQSLDDIADARVFDFGEDISIFIANKDWDLLRGTEIDYVTEGLNSALKFNNPNADTLCGCGESFSIRGT
ncbi:MAG: iron-sulfur cluster assembly accessory protein [Gammaproteobacteria bacterium]|nr:iron-sulfur cluster assembly accessory protein [Gammaproteobacteria bacterium]